MTEHSRDADGRQMEITIPAAQVPPLPSICMQDIHLYLVEEVLEKQNLENLTPKTFK